MKKEKIAKFTKILVFIALILVIIINAWLCDDAYISFRVIKNFVNGFGLRWNTFERVQVFTNPLMVLSLIPFYYVTHEIYYTSIIFNIVTSSIAIYIVMFKMSKNDWISILIAILLLSSRSFISFTTSGLENSLTFLLLSIFYYLFFKKDIYEKKDILLLSFIGSLILLNRMDSILLIIPSFFYIFSKRNSKITLLKFLIYFIIGMIPFIIWECFSLIYYGFLFPNTYYAKLNTGISKKTYIINGLVYLVTILKLDPSTIIIILFGSLLSFVKARRKELGLIIGIIVSIIYIIYVGGDFMLGRFLTPAFFTAIILASKLKVNFFNNISFKLILFISILLFIGYNYNYQKRFSKTNSVELNGVADERAFYFNYTSLLNVGSEKYISHSSAIDSFPDIPNIYMSGNIGFQGYFAGNDTIIIDYLALGDPLLSKLPSTSKTLYRIGHIDREIPEGYIKSIYYKENMIEDENLKKYYDVLKIITQDKILSAKRFKTIIKYHLGKYDYLVKKYIEKQEN